MHQTSLAASHAAKGALEGGLGRRYLQIGSHLPRPPGGIRPPDFKAALGNLRRNRLRMMPRSPRPIEQPGNPFLLIPRQPFVSDPAAHIEPPADCSN